LLKSGGKNRGMTLSQQNVFDLVQKYLTCYLV
jgi:hypothetical protein